MSRTHEVAWAAGFFDGEGYVTIQRRKQTINGKQYFGHYLRVGINHVAPEPLYEMQRLFGGKIEKQNPDTIVGNRKARHRWHLSTNSAKEMLVQILPYCKNKNNVIELALEFQSTVQTTKKVSNEIYIYRELLKEKITSCNTKD